MVALPRVVVCAPLPPGGLEPLEGVADVLLLPGSLPRERLLSALATARGFIAAASDEVDAALIESAPRLEIVANCAVGFDNVDLAAARRRGIWVTNTPDVLTGATAELTLALILAVTRRIVEGERELRAGRFTGASLTYMLGTGLSGKTLGIIGMGRIGRAVAGRALAFGMEVIYAERPRSRTVERARAVPLQQLLAVSDVVSLHVPLSRETYHLIDARALASMRAGAYLINVARGPVVDEAALARALASGHLGGAGLDVYEDEPRVHPELLRAPHTVLLPHLGSATLETRVAMVRLAAANVAALLEGGEPPTPVLRGAPRVPPPSGG